MKTNNTSIVLNPVFLHVPKGSMHAPYRHILRIQIVESVHVAVDMKQVTLHCTDTHTCMHTQAKPCL